MASVQLNEDWQLTKNTILERNRYLFNNPDMSDISFTCKGSNRFYAHKYVLGASSPVFHAMFYRALAGKDPNIHLPDANDESLEQFLRFLYTEECTLTADNVVATMYLATKYIIPSLSEKCVNFLVENLNLENVLDVLEPAIRFDEKELEKRCWKMIEFNTRKVVASDSFSDISQTTMAELLKRDILKISELELFQAVLKWIDLQCTRKNLKVTRQNRRSIIGEAIYDFRFNHMSDVVFFQDVCKVKESEVIAKQDLPNCLLTVEEIYYIWWKIARNSSPSRTVPDSRWAGNSLPSQTVSDLRWTQPKRKEIIIVRRFSGTKGLWDTWYHNEPNRLRFSIDKEAFLLGVGLVGKGKRKYQVNFEVKEATVTGKYTSQCNQDDIPGFDVMLEEPVKLEQNEVVTLCAEMEAGRDSCAGRSGKPSVTLEGVTVTFFDAPLPNNGTDVQEGQFHELILGI